MDARTPIERGRIAYSDGRWTDTLVALDEAERRDLSAADLERLAIATIMLGRHDDGIALLTEAHETHRAAGDHVAAARCASWIAMDLVSIGQMARGAGWFARAQRLIEPDAPPENAEGFQLIPEALGALYGGDAQRAADAFARAAKFAEQLGDPDLVALSYLGSGQADIMLGRVDAGLLALDEVMVAVTAGELSPIPSGIVYCAVLQSCRLAFDVRRASEWTRALDLWCAERPDMVAFTGQCHSHRCALFLLHGEWDDALAAAQLAQDRAGRGDFAGEYSAAYHLGDVYRLRGDFDAAEAAYLRAGRTGFDPQPGVALLRLAQGDVTHAQSLIRGAIDRAIPDERRGLLAAAVEIELAAGDVASARGVADELRELSASSGMLLLRAIADQAEACVLLAEGDARAAGPVARAAWRAWRDLDAPYEAARCRVLTARAYRLLGDLDGAAMEIDAARSAFLELGAGPDLNDRELLPAAESTSTPAGLTGREVEVLRLVAAGKSNRVIAGDLYLSDKTVARHLSNIFAKLGVSSRSAATAFAYEHHLVA